MTSGVPWHLRGVRPELIDSAREAARRSGMSVEEWLDTAIAESARNAGIESTTHRLPDFDQRRFQDPLRDNPRDNPADIGSWRRHEPRPDERHTQGSSFADVSARLDALARQVNHLSYASAARAPAWYPAYLPPRDEMYRSTTAPFTPVQQIATAPTVAGPDGTVDQALAEIEARQRMLDGGAAAPRELPRAPSQGLSDLEQQLREINARVNAMRPCGIDSAVETLRDDLAEIGMMLKEAMPRQAIESLESEIRALASRLDLEREGGADGITIAGLERGLAEVRDALGALKPAESLVGFDQAVQGLSQKVDRIANASHDPEAFKQLEDAIVALRGVVSHVASNDALAQLSDEVRSLSAKVDQVTGSDAFAAMERRIAAIADALEQSRGAPASDTSGLETVVRSLADKVDQLHASRFDQTAVNFLESRIGTLVEKLDASDAHLDHLGAIERGLADLLIQMEGQRMSAQRTGTENADTEALRRDVRHTQDSLETVHGTLGHVVDRLATIEAGIRDKDAPRAAILSDDFGPQSATAPTAPPTSSAPSATAAPARPSVPRDTPDTDPSPAPRGNPSPASERRPIDPSLPPDHPLEPGASRSRGHSAADRIAASEAALESIRPPVIPDPAGKSNFIAAARRAAQAAMVEAPPPREKRAPEATGGNTAADTSLTGKLSGHIRKLMVGAGVILVVLGAVHIVTTRLSIGTSSAPAEDQATHENAATAEPPRASAPSERHSVALPSGLPVVSPSSFGIGVGDRSDTTGSLVPASQATAAPAFAAPVLIPQPPQTPTPSTPADRLPAGIGSVGLRAAAVNGDPAAAFEIATRFADGRGVPQDLVEAATWFERAADKGVIQAQFRLGGLYEKGMGVTKNLETARRLYVAAAEAGHAKAMHNLAVLYAEGIEGKPNYATAARWFRKAADHGVTDSQYNLAILYARGIGVQTNMAEAFKWFALASREGDRDAAKKRDDIAGRLDKQTLTAAMTAAQSWQALPQPDAVEVKVPAGGRDSIPAPSTTTRSGAPKVDRASRTPTQ